MTEHLSEDIRREQILDSAMHLFVERGYEDTTVDEIAKAAGLSKGAIYWYYKSKLEILFALADRYIRDEQSSLIQMVEGVYGPEGLYKSHGDLYRNKLMNPLRTQIFYQLNGLAAHYPEIGAKLSEHLHQWDEVSGKLIQHAIENGHFRNTNAKYISQAISAMYQGLFERKQIDPDLDVLGVVELATKLFYDALIIGDGEQATGNR